MSSPVGADAPIGLGAITLGIVELLGVTHTGTPVLAFVALVTIGSAELITGSALRTRMAMIFRH